MQVSTRSTHISEITRLNCTKSFGYVARGRGSVVSLPRCDTLCTSGFADAGFDRKYPTATFDRLRYGFLTLPSAGDLIYFSIDKRK